MLCHAAPATQAYVIVAPPSTFCAAADIFFTPLRQAASMSRHAAYTLAATHTSQVFVLPPYNVVLLFRDHDRLPLRFPSPPRRLLSSQREMDFPSALPAFLPFSSFFGLQRSVEATLLRDIHAAMAGAPPAFVCLKKAWRWR